MRPTAKLPTIILINEHRNKISPSDLLLYPQITASLSPHQGSILQYTRGLTQKTTNWKMHRNCENLEHLVPTRCLCQTLSLKDQRAMCKRKKNSKR